MVLLVSPRPLSLPLSGRNEELDLGRGDDALSLMVQTHMHVHVRSAAAAASAAAVRYHSNLETCAVRAQSSSRICKSVPLCICSCNGNPPASTLAGNSNATGENFWDTADSALSPMAAGDDGTRTMLLLGTWSSYHYNDELLTASIKHQVESQQLRCYAPNWAHEPTKYSMYELASGQGLLVDVQLLTT
ncbi:hypothetical protein TgHK011_006088 [Trichoderma gracile]|nr:hypothetical protein TgHK011_006088 [Trichoderma gracile]